MSEKNLNIILLSVDKNVGKNELSLLAQKAKARLIFIEALQLNTNKVFEKEINVYSTNAAGALQADSNLNKVIKRLALNRKHVETPLEIMEEGQRAHKRVSDKKIRELLEKTTVDYLVLIVENDLATRVARQLERITEGDERDSPKMPVFSSRVFTFKKQPV